MIALKDLDKIDIVKALLHHGCNVDVQSPQEDLPLFIAVRNQSCVQAQLLLDKEPNILDKQSSGGWTALMVAAERGCQELMELFLNHNTAAINVQNTSGDTALMMACRNSHTQCVEMLLAHRDIVVDDKNRDECTALMMACKNGHEKIVNKLLNKGANLEKVDTRGCSALFYGVRSNNVTVVDLLIQYGANVNRKTVDGKNILEFLYDQCRCNPVNNEVVKLLKKVRNKRPTLQETFRLLLPLASEWENIGTLLGIPEQILTLIRHSEHATNVRSQLRKMLNVWLKSDDPQPTWHLLEDNIKLLDPSIAQKIKNTYM